MRDVGDERRPTRSAKGFMDSYLWGCRAVCFLPRGCGNDRCRKDGLSSSASRLMSSRRTGCLRRRRHASLVRTSCLPLKPHSPKKTHLSRVIRCVPACIFSASVLSLSVSLFLSPTLAFLLLYPPPPRCRRFPRFPPPPPLPPTFGLPWRLISTTPNTNDAITRYFTAEGVRRSRERSPETHGE